MGTTIDAVAVASGRGGLHRGGARRLADVAARDGLRRAGLHPDDVELLLNAGLYHDRLLGEPALAALIQEDIGANPEDPHPGGHGTFSFDVADGARGLLTALRVADGFLHTGTIRHALVVASDGSPGARWARHFPYAAAGAALVCGHTDGPGGLQGFRFADEPDDAGPHGPSRATVGLDHGRNRLRVHRDGGFARQAAALAGRVAGELLAEHGIEVGALDALVANPQQPDFVTALAAGLGARPGQVVAAPDQARVHTAGLAFALSRAGARLRPGATLLLVSAGAGLTAGATLLVVP